MTVQKMSLSEARQHTARPPATASPWRPRRGAGRRHPEAVDACGVVLLGSDPGPRDARQACREVGARVAAGRPACQRAARVLRNATALRVTRRPPRGSDGSYGPCGPAWTGRPGRPRRSRDAADRRIRGWRAPDRNRLGSASPAATARRAWLHAERIVSEALRVRGDLVKALAARQGPGGDRAAQGRPTATPSFGPGARRVPRRAPGRDEPPGGLVRLLNTWPHDRHDSRRRSSLRSAVIARDRGC